MKAGKYKCPSNLIRNGRSLAISSANKETTNRIRKIQNDQYPRRFDLKFCQRRRLSGDGLNRWRVTGTASPSGDCVVVSIGGGAVMVIRLPAPRNQSVDRSTCKGGRRSDCPPGRPARR